MNETKGMINHMTLQEFLDYLNSGKRVAANSPAHQYMHAASQEALRLTAELNGSYHSPEELREIFSRLIGKPVDDGFGLFPPFYTDFGKNITLGKNVFFNSGCKVQDQGGVTIGDETLIGHDVVLATLNHGILPEERHDLLPAPIKIGRNAWIGSGSVILPGVTIGDNAVIAAGSVVTKNVAAGDVVGGVPAKRLHK